MGSLMSSLGYEVSPETVRGAEKDLTAEALAGLDRRAAAIADRLHLRVLRYRDLQVGNAETGDGPMPRFAAMAMAAPVGAARRGGDPAHGLGRAAARPSAPRAAAPPAETVGRRPWICPIRRCW